VQPSTIGLPGTRCSPILSRCAPREVSPAFNNAIVAMCHSAGLAPTFVEMPEPRVEHVLLAVAVGAGLALLPETVTERFAAPGSASLPSRQAKPPSAARY